MSVGPRVPPDLDHAGVPVPPPLIFLGYLVAALVLNRFVPVAAPWATISRILVVLAVVVGVWLVGAAFSQLVKQKTTVDPHAPTTALVDGGPYRFTRNPIYPGFFLIYLGLTLLAGTLWGLIVSPLLLWTVTRLVIRAEESYLGYKFNGAYADYRARVGRCL